LSSRAAGGKNRPPAAIQKPELAELFMAIILCIDDEPNPLQARKFLLESEGHQVIEAASGKEGLRIFQSRNIDAVVLDYWMSGMNGLAVAQEIKRLRPHTPIIMLSGFPELPGEAVGLADRWILKGRGTRDLLVAIAELVPPLKPDESMESGA
jgi:CheY-like chemotaxis protein